MEKIIFHIDVNNAFLSWTGIKLLKEGFKKDIRDTYAIIGGDEKTRNGIVLAKSILAKSKGIVTAETIYSARKKCPGLAIYPPEHKFYHEMSNKLFLLLSKYTPDIEVASIDECYLDYGKVKKLYGEELTFAKKIQQEIYDTLGFTVNIGIANNKLCAKMASDFSKPNKIHTLYDNEIVSKMYPLPINDLFGIGPKTALKLKEMDINTIGDLANYDDNKLNKRFKNQGYILINMAKGIDNSEVISESTIQKGISNEITLIKDANNRQELYNPLLLVVEQVALRLRRDHRYAYTITVILKDNTFKRRSHQKKLVNATNITSEIYETAKQILDEMWNYDQIRLIGVRVDNLVTNITHQNSLFENYDNLIHETFLDETVDRIKNKYGVDIINKASLVDSKRHSK